MEYLTLLLPIISFVINLFVKDANKKKKMIEFIEARIGTSKSTVELREDYERQIKEFKSKAKDGDSPLH